MWISEKLSLGWSGLGTGHRNATLGVKGDQDSLLTMKAGTQQYRRGVL